MIKKFLITGSNGLLGQKITSQLNNFPETKFLATSRGNNRNSKISQDQYQSLDILDSKAIQETFARFKPDVLIHTAALTQVDECELNQKACWQINVEAIYPLINACQAHGTHFIYISTDYIFDGKSGPYRETDVPNPISFYGRSKLAAETIIQESAVPWTILRTMLVFGVAEIRLRQDIVQFVLDSLRQGHSINVVNDQFRSPTWVEDLAVACIETARRQVKGIYHISGKDFMCILELAVLVARFFNLNTDLIKPVSSEILAQTGKRPHRTGFILDKAKRDLNYQPHSFMEALAEVQKQMQALGKTSETKSTISQMGNQKRDFTD